jgi:hypothetical protein
VTSPLTATPEAASPPPSAMTRLMRFTERFGHMMSRIILTVLYVALVAPAGLVLALLGDPLRIKRWRGTSWVDWRERNDTLELARRQG